MKRQIDAEIQKKNYEKELLLCKKAGGDIERYRRLRLQTKSTTNVVDFSRIKALKSAIFQRLFGAFLV